MASLLLHCSTTTPLSPHRHNFCNSPLPHSPNRLNVSCAGAGGGGNHGDTPQFDRRNILLGMGGSLYGATNLIAGNPPATAAPIPPPSLDKCSTATDVNANIAIEFNCCPPAGPTLAPDYVLPTVSKLRVRPALHLAGDQYLYKFQRAVQAMKDLAAKDPNDPRGFMQQAHVHCAYCNLAYPQSPGSDLKLQIHSCWHFFPWHRWYLYFYERICAKLIDDPTFALPFWNWDNPAGMVMPEIFTNETSTLYNPRRDLTHYPPEPVDLHYDESENRNSVDQIIENNLTQMYNEMIQDSKTLVGFYGEKYVVGTQVEPKPGKVEEGSHTAVHRWVGQRANRGYDMGNFATAGRDMLFYCHHVNIDRLWSVWRDMRDKSNKQKDFEDSDWLDAKFVFYDENAKPVTVRVGDSLDNRRMGFTWQQVDNPWTRSKPTAYAKKSTTAFTTSAPRPSDNIFPVKLDKVLRVVVERPRRRRSGWEKEEEEELLEISGLETDATRVVRFEVFVNGEDADPDDLISRAEYAGCYAQVPLTKSGRIKTKLTLGLTELLEELENEEDDRILVTVVPRVGGQFTTIGGMKIVFAGI